jgi:hypothetical protein
MEGVYELSIIGSSEHLSKRPVELPQTFDRGCDLVTRRPTIVSR